MNPSKRFFVVILLSFSFGLLSAQDSSFPDMKTLKKLTLEDLMNIEVVTASRVKQKISEAPSTMMVITAEQIRERGYQQLEDVLRDIPGVDMIHTYGQAPTFITFRGMYGDENRRLLLMVDGVVENNLIGNYEMAGPAYSLFNAERIEIIWGPGSALYGANAYGAVINIITKKGEDINGFHYQKGYGSYNTSTENVLMGVKKSNVEMALSGSLFNTDGPRFTNKDPRYSSSYVKNAWSFNGAVSHVLKNVRTTLNARAYQTPGGMGEIIQSPTVLLGLPAQGHGNTGEGGVLPSDFNGEKPSLIDRFSRALFLQSEFKPGSKLTLFIRGLYRETGVSDKSYIYFSTPGTGFAQRGIYAYSANRIKSEVSFSYAISEHQLLSAGIQFSQDNLERGIRGVIADTQMVTISNIPVTNIHARYKPRESVMQDNTGACLQYILSTTLLKKTNFTLGGRYDNNNVYGSTLIPRAGIINQPNDKLTFKLLYGHAFRAPTNFELYTRIGVRIPNPDLKPEMIRTCETNIIYAPVKTLLLQANIFRNQLTDIIIQDVPIGNGMTQNQNTGNAVITGLETKLDIIPAGSCSAFLNFTYQEGTQNNGTITSPIPNIAKVKGNIGCCIHVAELFNISLVENWVGERSVPQTNPLGKVDGYFITNFVLSTTKLFNNRVSASLAIQNLFNETYYDPGVRTADGHFYPTVNNQPGINGMFKVSVSIN